jgi:hypothetical protein
MHSSDCQFVHKPGRKGAHKDRTTQGAHHISKKKQEQEEQSENSDSEENNICAVTQGREQKTTKKKSTPTDPCPMCKKKYPKDRVDHKFFECTSPTRLCVICGGKHTIYLCPNVVCQKCTKTGHSEKVCEALKGKRG